VTMFRNVQLRVKRAIGQDPWLSFPTLPAIYFAGSAADEQVELTHWTSVKDSTSPTVLATYLQRYPSGQFASLARALIEHYEQQRKAEEAAREEQRKRREEADKAAEVKRLEDERQAREAALADERRRTGSGKSSADIKRQSEQEQAEMLAAQEKLRGALEEARIAREAAKRAEEERLAAVKAAEEATKAAEEAIARRRDTDATNDQVRLAALPKLEKPPGKDQFDGTWSVRRTADPGKCKFPIHSFTLTITNGAIRGSSGGTGSISVSGAGSWIGYAPTDGAPTRFQGTFRGNSGSGRFTRTTDDRCSGTFIARRN
jgi:hypothetical protein